MINKFVIGTRGSKLALIQTDIVKRIFLKKFPTAQLEIKTITTKGDKDKKSPIPLDTVGKDWFSKEIDKALLVGSIDMAVHSLKDLTEELPKGLLLAAVPEREDEREVFISRNGVLFNSLKKNAIVGTDSTRRKAQILQRRPDLIVTSIRGNVDSRLSKLEKGEYDAIFLAAAGLKRLGREEKITEYFSQEDFIPAPGQGALAVVIKKTNKTLLAKLQKINDSALMDIVTAERSFSKFLGGGCSSPIGAYAKYTGKKMTLFGFIGSLDGRQVLKDSVTSSATPEEIGEKLAKRMLKKNGFWNTINNTGNKPFVIITRPEKDSKKFATHIEKLGLRSYSYPTIEIDKLPVTETTRTHLKQLETFDLIIFTSGNAVRFFINAINDSKINLSLLDTIKIAAVGEKTASELKKYKLTTHVLPSQFTAKDLVSELIKIKGKKILLPRSDIATPQLVQSLKKKGALVVSVPLYQTKLIVPNNTSFAQLVKNEAIACITFTSPSTVRGFIKSVESLHLDASIFSIPALAIGPVTTKALKKYGFKNIYTADVFTEDGMINKLKESIL